MLRWECALGHIECIKGSFRHGRKNVRELIGSIWTLVERRWDSVVRIVSLSFSFLSRHRLVLGRSRPHFFSLNASVFGFWVGPTCKIARPSDRGDRWNDFSERERLVDILWVYFVGITIQSCIRRVYQWYSSNEKKNR